MKKKRGRKRNVERSLVTRHKKKHGKNSESGGVSSKAQLAVESFVNALHASKLDSRLWRSFVVDLGGKILITLLWALFFLFIFLPFLFRVTLELYSNPQLAENTSLTLFLPVLGPFLLFLLASFLVGMLFNAFVWKITAKERFTLSYYGKLLALRLIFLVMLAPLFYVMLLFVVKLKTFAVLFILLVLLAFAHVYFVSLVLLTRENILAHNLAKGFRSYSRIFAFLLPYVFILMLVSALYFINNIIVTVSSSIIFARVGTAFSEQALMQGPVASQLTGFFVFLGIMYLVILALSSLFYAYIRIFYYEVVRQVMT